MPDHLMHCARRLLRQHFGHPDFRPAQVPVLRSIFEGRDTLAVLPTGGGKSVCFQIPALTLGGLTVVVSPLVSLMRDQVRAARVRGIPAAALNSTLSEAERGVVWESVRSGALRLLYVSPERLDRLAPELRDRGIRPTLLAVDEAHCIAEWGSDFRPSYRTLRAARYRLGQPQTIALTGSATPEVRRDIIAALALGCSRGGRPARTPAVHLASFDRPNLWLGAALVRSERERLRALLGLFQGDDRMALVYAPTRSTCEAIARVVREAGHRAQAYHAGLRAAHRAAVLEDFLDDRLDVVVATCAFGMGIDKPNVRLIVHWTAPATLESYYQEAGRAGRDGEFARCVLLWRDCDAVLHRRQLEVTFPPERLVERIWASPAGRSGVPRAILESAERLRRELRPERGPVDWRRVRERRRRAEARIRAVARYASGDGCRRARLVGYFGETLGTCAGCDRCGKRRLPAPPDRVIAERLRSLQRALRSVKTPWGGSPMEPETLLLLARNPPASAAALADVPGVGPMLAERMGAAILSALGVAPGEPRRSPSPDNLADTLNLWRAETAGRMGVPEYVVLPDGILRRIAEARPRTRQELARIPGFGPRALAKFGDSIVDLFRD